jgi:hypothetical protein
MADHEHFTVEEIEKALRKALGLKSYAAKNLGCDYKTIDNYCKRYKKLQKIIDEMKETRLDIAESKLMTGVNEGNPTLIIFLLKTQGKGRGYVERQEHEHTGKDGGPIQQNITAETRKKIREEIYGIFDKNDGSS